MTFNAITFIFSVLQNKALTLKQVQCQHKSELVSQQTFESLQAASNQLKAIMAKLKYRSKFKNQ